MVPCIKHLIQFLITFDYLVLKDGDKVIWNEQSCIA